MEYLEDLPPSCPPESAVDQSIYTAYRVVQSNPPTADCFQSQAARGRPLREGGDPCKHASCSLFTCYEKASNIAKLLPKPRKSGRLLAKLILPTGAGLSLTKNKHVDFWFYKTFAPTSAVVNVEELS